MHLRQSNVFATWKIFVDFFMFKGYIILVCLLAKAAFGENVTYSAEITPQVTLPGSNLNLSWPTTSDAENTTFIEQSPHQTDHDVLFNPPTFLNKNRPEIIGFPNLTIDCTTTHSDVHMELFVITSSGKKLIASSNNSISTEPSNSTNSSWSYSPSKGFIFRNIVTSAIMGHYECVATNLQLKTSSFMFNVEVYGVEVVPLSKTQRAEAGSEFQLTCRGRKPLQTTPMRLSWQWIPSNNSQRKPIILNRSEYPPGMPSMTFSTLTSTNLGLIYTYTLRWKSIPVEASGIYKCSDLDNQNDFSWTTQLNVFLKPFSTLYRRMVNGYRSMTKSLEYSLNKSLENSFLEKRFFVSNFKAGDNFQIVCREPTKPDYRLWVKPSRPNDDEFYRNTQTKPLTERWSSEFSNNETFWTSKATITNASYLDTGYYFCFDAYTFTKLSLSNFIFIQDSQNLVLPPMLRKIGPDRRVIVNYNAEHVPVGCGPVHPDVQVDLKHKNTADKQFKVISSSIEPNNSNSIWTFTIYDGFSIKRVDSWEIKGEFMCEARWPNQTKTVSVTDQFQFLVQGVEILPFNNEITVVEGEELTLTCRSKDIEYSNLTWQWVLPDNRRVALQMNGISMKGKVSGLNYLNPPEMEKGEEESSPLLGMFKFNRLRWGNISMKATGRYRCYDANDLNIAGNSTLITVLGARAPILDGPNTVTVPSQRNDEINLVCNETAALPRPNIQWFRIRSSQHTNAPKQEEISNDLPSPDYTVNTAVDGRTSQLIVHHADSNAEFLCVFSNQKGEAKKHFIITVGPTSLSTTQIAAIVIGIIVILLVIIIIIRFMFVKSIRKQKEKYQEVVNTRLKLLEGNLERINPDKPIEDQLDYLPYDSKFEIPFQHITLGKQLGAGQFGRVLQAEVIGLDSSCNTSHTTVAVKMAKSLADNTALSSLAYELKILIHLGCHLNVVNLLGACTEKLSKGELLVIVEFCRYGNLKDFLFSNRSNFISEPIHDLGSMIQCRVQRSLSATRSQKSTVCVHDLINWSFQTACGMNYLTKRKVLHGDLAARNLLLADDDFVKIADFGLSRQIYENSNYEKQGEEALPVRWMAIESLIDRVFSSKSDVWAFGVTMWEIFSLSQQPYPKVLGLADLVEFLLNGHRMEKPEHAPEIMGNIMASCWKHDPDDRITFNELEQTLGQLVNENTRRRYISVEVNDSYGRLQSEPECDSTNYLKMSNPPASKVFESQQESVDYENVLAKSNDSSKPSAQFNKADESLYISMGPLSH